MIWRDEFKIGIVNIDEQHEELFARYNDLLECIRKSDDGEKIKKNVLETLDFLSEYIIYHFDHEEKYQKEVDYPERIEHKKIHNNFKKTVIDFKREFLKDPNNKDFLNAFSGYLSTWLINHICDEDQKIYYHVHKENIEIENNSLEKPIDIIEQTVKAIFMMLSQLQVEICEDFQLAENDFLTIEIQISGDYENNLFFQFPNEFIIEMIKKMLNMNSVEIDSFAIAALKEIVNTVAGHIVNRLQTLALYSTISVPQLSQIKTPEQKNVICFESSAGKFKLFLD